MKKTLFSAFALICMLILNNSSRNAVLFDNGEFASSAEIQSLATNTTTPETAKKLLLEGNKRYVENKQSKKDTSFEKRKELNLKGQTPFAVILSCSDSRVPPEIIFDQGLGDLFVARNAGNLADPIVSGTVEYGVEYLNTPLVLVLGHENCGAVKAAADGVKAEGDLNFILEKIRPICEKLKIQSKDKDTLLENSVDANIKNTMLELRKNPVISRLEKEGKIQVIGGKYHMESGVVEIK